MKKKRWLFPVVVVVLAVFAVLAVGGGTTLATRPSTWVVFDPEYQTISTVNRAGTSSVSWECMVIDNGFVGRLRTVTDLFGVGCASLYADDLSRTILSINGEPCALLVVDEEYGYVTAIVLKPDGTETRFWGRVEMMDDELYISTGFTFNILQALGFPLSYVTDEVWLWRTSN